MASTLIHSGKVRDVYEINHEHLMMIATDKVSSFDRHIGIIPGKGELLNKKRIIYSLVFQDQLIQLNQC